MKKRQKIRGLEEWKIGKENSNDKRRWIATQPAVARNDGRSGFTLVELVIVIAIVIILSVVSVPIYRGYTRNAKMSEGYALLGTILSAQKAYYSQYGYFLYAHQSSAGNRLYTNNDEVLGIDARGNKYFTCFAVNLTGGNQVCSIYIVKPSELASDKLKSALRIWHSVSSGSTYQDNQEPYLINGPSSGD